jgi:hypothetical protein
LATAIGIKFSDEAARDIYDTEFKKLGRTDRMHVLSAVLGDDWSTALKAVASAALPHVWSSLKNTTYGRKAISALK